MWHNDESESTYAPYKNEMVTFLCHQPCTEANLQRLANKTQGYLDEKRETPCIKHKEDQATSLSSVDKWSKGSALEPLSIIARLINIHAIIVHVSLEKSFWPAAGI